MAGTNYTPPKLYDITVPDLFTLIAHENPGRDLVQIIREHTDAPTDSVRLNWATVLQLAQNAAADLRARWASSLQDGELRSRAAQPRQPGASPVVAGMLGASGYEYYVNMLACSLNRWTVLHISPKNSPDAIEHLLRASNASLLVVDASGSRVFDQSIPGTTVLPFASSDTLENGSAVPPLIPPTQEQLLKEMDLPAFYMHTSGSTGHPKLITWTHRFFLGGCRTRHKDGPADIGLPFYSIPPICHAMGMFAMGMFIPAHANLIIFVSSPNPKPPSASALLSYIPFIKGGVVALPPSILEELYALGPEAVKTVAEGLSSVIFAGAPLKTVVGNALIAAGLRLTSAYGSTELGPGTKLYPRSEDWEYMEFREGYDWQFLPVDGNPRLGEMIVVPAEDCPAVINHDNPPAFETSDIWERHPSKPHLWRYYQRKGDVTVLSNGEKTDNKQIEGLLLQDSNIRHVVVFGAGRLLNGVLLKPSNPFQSTSEFLSQIQPTIDHANTILPRHSRLVPELIIIASHDKPFATTDKGTVKAKETRDRFEDEIATRYAILDEGRGGEWAFDGSVTSSDDIRNYLRKTVNGLLDKDVADTTDLFEQGLDSLLAIQLRSALVAVVKNTPTASQAIPRNITYTFPTIARLTDFLLSHTSNDGANLTNTPRDRILRSIAKFSSDFVPHKPGNKTSHGSVIALTGSTGSLGCSLLALLLDRADISKIYLLNRKGLITQKERQAVGFQNRGLDPGVLEAKKGAITYLDIDFSREDLGLTKEAYEDLRDNVTHIIHAAWHLNFNLILESYERVHIAGVRHLINLALSSPQKHTPRLVFLSSISAAGAYRGPYSKEAEEIIVPEEPISDPSVPLDQGYGQGKYVSERIIVGATQQAGLQATIVRVGQLSGVATNGAWSLSEHVPIVFRSSIALGMIPNDLPPVRWVPSDVAASAIVKQMFGSSSPLEYFHVENTVATQWEDIAQAVSASSPQPLRLVSLSTWLEHITVQDVDVERVPAVRLLDFFHGMADSSSVVVLGSQRSVKVAPEIAVGPVLPQLVGKYVTYQLQSRSSGSA